MEAFDRLVPELMHRYNLPGGALAIVKDGRLVFARGYGLADIQNQEPVQPDSLFRIASLSKQVTAVAALKLVEDGKLDLDENAFEILSDFKDPEGASRDPRIDQITVRHLLHHAGGWDKEVAGFDPMWIPARIARETGAAKPISCSDVIHFMLGQPLDFDPGTRYAYANFGYCVLGRIIEKKARSGLRNLHNGARSGAGGDQAYASWRFPAERPRRGGGSGITTTMFIAGSDPYYRTDRNGYPGPTAASTSGVKTRRAVGSGRQWTWSGWCPPWMAVGHRLHYCRKRLN